MGLFNDIGKLLFGAKSAARSAGEKAAESSDQIMDSTRKKGKEMYEQTKAGAGKLADQAGKSVDHLFEKYKNWQKDVVHRSKQFDTEITDRYDEAASMADDRLEKLKKRAEEFREELADDKVDQDEKEISEKLDDLEKEKKAIEEDLKSEAEEIRNQAEKMRSHIKEEIREEKEKAETGSKRIKDSAEAIGESIFASIADLLDNVQHSARDLSGKMEQKSIEVQKRAHAFLHDKDEHGVSLMDQAKSTLYKLKSTWTDTMDQAQKAAKEDQESEPYRSSPQDKENLRKSEMDDKDEFWRKAEAFAVGDYDRIKEMKIEKVDTPPAEQSSGTVPGFTDEDGDGNEIIDDAIVIDEEE